MKHAASLGIAGLAVLTAAFAVALDTESTLTPVLQYRIVNTYPHDNTSYTQGLAFVHGVLYEGSGLYGGSSLRKVNLTDGRVLEMRTLDSQYFGEGITVLGSSIYQLTWKSRTAFVYDLETLDLTREVFYPTEGWGLTNDSTHLILSDGTDVIRFLNPETFDIVGQIRVHDNARPVDRLNELEYVEGKIYSNVYGTDSIAVICPQTGAVTAWVDLTGLLSPQEQTQADVLNGIAYDADRRRFFVTGKLWPRMYEIEFVAEQTSPPAQGVGCAPLR